MCSTSSVAAASSSVLASQISTTVAKKAQDVEKETGAQAVAMISSAKAISNLNAAATANPSENAVDVYG